jgi:hypothetical protein
MAIGTSPVQSQTATVVATTTTGTIVLGAAPTSGNTLYLLWVNPTSGAMLTSLVQTNVTWSLITRGITNANAEIWQGLVSGSASATMTYNCTSRGNSAFAYLLEWAGVDPTGGNQAGATASNSNASSTSVTTSTITPTAGTNVLMVACTRHAGAYSSGPSGGFTALAPTGQSQQFCYQVVASASGSYTAAWVYGAANTAEASIATFAAAAAGGSTWGPLLGLQNNRLVVA